MERNKKASNRSRRVKYFELMEKYYPKVNLTRLIRNYEFTQSTSYRRETGFKKKINNIQAGKYTKVIQSIFLKRCRYQLDILY